MLTDDLRIARSIESATAPLLAKLTAQQKRIEVLEAALKQRAAVDLTRSKLDGMALSDPYQIDELLASIAAAEEAAKSAARAALNPTEKQNDIQG